MSYRDTLIVVSKEKAQLLSGDRAFWFVNVPSYQEALPTTHTERRLTQHPFAREASQVYAL